MLRILATLLLFAPCAQASAASSSDEFFESRIRPVLISRCFKCHGDEEVGGGLRLDSRQSLLKGGSRGAAVDIAQAGKSVLLAALRGADPELQMPPEDPLPKHMVDDFEKWIAAGAVWPESQILKTPRAQSHWAFQPLRAVPTTVPSEQSNNGIDRWIADSWKAQGLSPVEAASRLVLLRRVYFDLIGLPPAPEQVERFLADNSANAYQHVVEDLLASPRYGERFGRHWLDVVRYADTAGDNADYPVPEARLYRDYVIDAFQKDKPYDQFVREQLAGDLLVSAADPAEVNRERVIATGYLALARRYATAPYELWHLTLEDVIDTTGRAFLGLSLRCARCHDHKFDPIPQRDYYALYGIFASTQFPWAGGEEFHSKKTPRQHFVPLLPKEQAAARKAALAQEIERLSAAKMQAEKLSDKDNARRLGNELAHHLAAQKLGVPPATAVAYAVTEGIPIDAHVHLRGEPDKPGRLVPRGIPTFLSVGDPIAIPATASGRAQLADWLTRRHHPLTARVIANRIWQWHFGKGLVATPSDFGRRGSAPTHPELLDWLAQRLIDSGWSIKSLHRDIVLSRTYQLASTGNASNEAVDPDNRYYWRFDRRRLDAESLRDAMLAVSEQLNLNRPGEHPFPAVEKWNWTQHSPFKAVYESNHRTVYLMTQRFQRHPYLALFDGPETNTSTDLRRMSIVPPQALFFMNNAFVAEQAAGVARRLIRSSHKSRGRIELAGLLCWSRRPTAGEIAHAQSFIDQATSALAASAMPPSQAEQEAWSSYARVLLASNEFLYVD